MGTNYYHRTKICKHCDRYDEHHIGKSSGGWTFSFHGSREEDQEFSELNGKIVSFSDWKERLKSGKIFDEYGEEISFEDWVKLVESKRDSKYNHTTYCLDRPLDRSHAERYCWLDDEGNSFNDGEFS